MAFIIAENEKQVRRKFTEKAWNILVTGKDGSKQGWRQVSDQTVSNAKTVSKPNTGGGKSSGPVVEQKISDTRFAKPDKTKTESAGPDLSKKSEAESKADFLKAAEGINTGVIKDFFDKNKIKYGKKDLPETLYALLGETLNYNTTELQNLFS